jgi:hypothetical protein
MMHTRGTIVCRTRVSAEGDLRRQGDSKNEQSTDRSADSIAHGGSTMIVKVLPDEVGVEYL